VEELAKRVGNIDLVYEAVGEGHATWELMRVLGINGVFIMTGIPAEKQPIPVFADNIMRNITLKNQAIIGTVNASPQAFADAIAEFSEELGSEEQEDLREILLERSREHAARNAALDQRLDQGGWLRRTFGKIEEAERRQRERFERRRRW